MTPLGALPRLLPIVTVAAALLGRSRIAANPIRQARFTPSKLALLLLLLALLLLGRLGRAVLLLLALLLRRGRSHGVGHRVDVKAPAGVDRARSSRLGALDEQVPGPVGAGAVEGRQGRAIRLPLRRGRRERLRAGIQICGLVDPTARAVVGGQRCAGVIEEVRRSIEVQAVLAYRAPEQGRLAAGPDEEHLHIV